MRGPSCHGNFKSFSQRHGCMHSQQGSCQLTKEWPRYDLTSCLAASLPNLLGYNGRMVLRIKIIISDSFWWRLDKMPDLVKIFLNLLIKSSMAAGSVILVWKVGMSRSWELPQYQPIQELFFNANTSTVISQNIFLLIAAPLSGHMMKKTFLHFLKMGSWVHVPSLVPIHWNTWPQLDQLWQINAFANQNGNK